jgi:hypothetical protein
MYQIAVTYGLAEKFGDVAEFAPHAYFNLPQRTKNIENIYVQPAGLNEVFDIPHKLNMTIVGFFQRYEYFNHIKEKLIKDVFKVPYDYRPDSIAVHVRRGDFIQDPINFPMQSVEYYKKAFDIIGIDNKKLYFCSDDPDWCEDNFGNIPNVYVRRKKDPLEDIYFMANCDAVIMANSTFSFWGSYLNMRERPIVFPLHWFSKKSKRTGYEICPSEWTGI